MPDYDLDKLGWYEFERLTQVLLKSKLGLGIESWGGRGDWGRDAYYEGELAFPSTTPTKGPFLFQCKFVEEANAAGSKPSTPLLKSASEEINRIKKRLPGSSGSIKEGLSQWKHVPAVFTLITNAPLTSSLRKKLKDKFQEVLSTTTIVIMGGKDVSGWIDLATGIARRFPQILGLRDLRELLRSCVQKEILERSEEAIREAEELSPVFVPTNSFSEAVEKLHKHFFVVLEGPPEVGKTTIARMIALSMIPNGWEVHECQTPTDVLKVYESSEHQVYICDDSFGRTEYDPSAVRDWQKDLPTILRKLDAKHLLILTCRKHLLEMAKSRLDVPGDHDRFPDLGEVLVDVASLKEHEKALILYKHSKQQNLAESARLAIRTFAEQIVRHEGFSPERIRSFTKGVSDLTEISDFDVILDLVGNLIPVHFAQPTDRMKKAFNALTVHQQWLLISLLALGGSARVVEDSTGDLKIEYEALCPLDSREPFDQTLNELSASFIKIGENIDSSKTLTWIHPTWGDMVSARVREVPQLRLGFLERSTARGLRFAISSGGGHSGGIILPLVESEDEWCVLERRVGESEEPGAKLLDDCLNTLLVLKRDENADVPFQKLDNLVKKQLAPLVIHFRNSKGWSERDLIDFLDSANKVGLSTGEIDFGSGWEDCVARVTTRTESNLVAFQGFDSINNLSQITKAAVENDKEFLRRPEITQEWESVVRSLREWGFDNSEHCLVSEDDHRSLVSEARGGYDRLGNLFEDIGFRYLQDNDAELFNEIAERFRNLVYEAEEVSGVEDEDEEEDWDHTEDANGLDTASIPAIFVDL